MAQFSRRLRTLANQLGVPTPDEVKAIFEEDSETVAEIVRRALQDIVDEINGKSMTGTLDGYIAMKIPVNGQQDIQLTGSRITLSGHFEWFVYVQERPEHTALELNVFNVLDRGRPALPKRQRGQGPYILWNADPGGAPNSRIIGNVRRLSISRTPRQEGVFRTNESWRSNSSSSPDIADVPITMGPIQAVPGQHLYEAALRRAKDRLTVKGLNRQWDVIKVGFE